MGIHLATCGHDITDYPWDWPAVWTRGWHSKGWSYSVLCFPCIQKVQAIKVCTVQFTEPETLKGASWLQDTGD